MTQQTESMAQALSIEFTMCYRNLFYVLGHHIYKSYRHQLKMKNCSHAIGVYKKDDVLVGHIPIEISSLIDYFLKDAIVIGKRKWEVGLVIPVTYIAVTKDLQVATILKELEKRKTKYSHFEMEFDINQHVKNAYI